MEKKAINDQKPIQRRLAGFSRKIELVSVAPAYTINIEPKNWPSKLIIIIKTLLVGMGGGGRGDGQYTL